jgi:hypothetical protein
MRSKEEIRGFVEGFAKSGMTRREYCAKYRIGMTTLDYWRRAHRKQMPRLVKVELEQEQALPGFALGWPMAGASRARGASPKQTLRS